MGGKNEVKSMFPDLPSINFIEDLFSRLQLFIPDPAYSPWANVILLEQLSVSRLFYNEAGLRDLTGTSNFLMPKEIIISLLCIIYTQLQ